MVFPPAESRSSTPSSSSAFWGSREAVGSSKMIISGCMAIMSAMLTRFFSPPLR